MIQLLLPLTASRPMTFDNLVLHEGIASAVSTIRSVYSQTDLGMPPLFLWGPSGAGKSHILQAAAALAARTLGPAAAPPRVVSAAEKQKAGEFIRELISLPEEDWSGLSCAAIDDIQELPSEEWGNLWSLFNRSTRRALPLMTASSQPAAKVFAADEHLLSRMTSGLVFRLDPPPDHARILILDRMARDRNVLLPREVINYLVTRKDRNVKELERLLEVLDNASLELKRRITIPLTKILEKQGVI